MPVIPATVTITLMRGTIRAVACAASRVGASGACIRCEAKQSGKEARSLSYRLHNGYLRFKGQIIDLAADTARLGYGFEQIIVKTKAFQFLVLFCCELSPSAAGSLIEHIFRQTAAEFDDLSRREAYAVLHSTLYQTG